MGKKGSWISSVKKALTFESKDTKEKKSESSKSKSYKKNGHAEAPVVVVPPPAPSAASEKPENEQNMDAYSTAIATAAAAEAAAAAARAAAAEVARITATVLEAAKSKQEAAAVRIQIAFRAHLARKEVRALRGQARLKSMIEGRSVQRQSMITLQCMRTLTRVQSQIRSRRLRMLEENLLLQQQLQQKSEKETDKPRAPVTTTYSGEDWNASAASKEEVEAKLQNKEDAALRRERALAYAYSHQIARKPLKPGNSNPGNPTFTNQTNWGWSWLERWASTRPWEIKTIQDQHLIDHENTTSQKGNQTPKPKAPPSTPPPRARSVGPKTRPTGIVGNGSSSGQLEHQRRHSIAGSLVKNYDSLASSKTVSSNVKGKVKPRVTSRLGNGKADKGSSLGSVKKQLSYSSSQSEHAKVDLTP